jgi:hypothetical protein
MLSHRRAEPAASEKAITVRTSGTRTWSAMRGHKARRAGKRAARDKRA